MPEMLDTYRMNENEQIDRIGRMVMNCTPNSTERPRITGVVVDNQDKATRYISKLKAKFPGIRVIDQGPGLTEGTVLIRLSGPLQ